MTEHHSPSKTVIDSLLLAADELCAAAVSFAGDVGTSHDAWIWEKIEAYQAARAAHETLRDARNQADAAPSDAGLAAPTPRGSLPNSLGAILPNKATTDVLAERQRQVTVEGWTPEHDDEHSEGALVEAAVCYASHAAARAWCYREAPEEYRSDRPFPREKEVFGHGCVTWPKYWSWDWWKPKDPRRDLVRAAALILAEIERIDRESAQNGGTDAT